MTNYSRTAGLTAVASPEWTPYESNEAYFEAQLRRLDLIIRLQLRQAGTSVGPDANPDLHGLLVTREDVDAMLTPAAAQAPAEGPRDDGMLQQLMDLETMIRARVGRSWHAKLVPSLEMLGALFRLSPFELDVLVVSLAPELDGKYDQLYAYLQDDVTRRRPSVGLVLNLLCHSFEEVVAGRAAFQPAAPLLRHGLIGFVDDEGTRAVSLLSRSLKLDERIVGYLLHGQATDPRLDAIVRRVPTEHAVEEVPLPERTRVQLGNLVAHLQHRLADHQRQDGAGTTPLRCHLYGPYGAGKEQAAAAVCHDLGLSLVAVDAGRLLDERQSLAAMVRRIEREMVLAHAAGYIEALDQADERPDRPVRDDEIIAKAFARVPMLLFFAERTQRNARTGTARSALHLAIPPPDYDLRVRIWHEALADVGMRSSDIDVDELANQFRFTGQQIRDAVRQASSQALLQRGAGASVDRELMLEGCRAQCSIRLRDLARKIAPAYGWEDIILPTDGIALLREMCDQIRLHHWVLELWGFGRKMSRGRGLAALYCGASGTGKTMAAEIIAGELGMDLYEIDLSSVVSKYIGETEKNLKQVFAEAEGSNTILFFDEADALFGRRSEVKDSHDRYANIEINYLLQRIEQYEGVVILATNMRNHLDDAFTRRLRFCVEFPFPDESGRRRIWRQIFPAEVPLAATIDFDFLAERFKLSGGNIRNTALTGAFLAAKQQTEVSMHHIVLALKREYQKMGRIPTKAEFGKYYAVVAEETSR